MRYLSEGAGEPIGWPDGTKPNSAWANVIAGYGLVCNAVVMVWIVQRWRAATASARRMHAAVWLCEALMLSLLTAGIVATAGQLPTGVQVALLLGYGLCVVSFPFAFLGGLVRVRLARQRVADLVVALKDTADPARLRDLLSETLGDPSLVLGFWSDVANGYVDADGRPVPTNAAGPARVTLVEGREGKLAALVHDPALAEQQPLVRAVVAAARLALENARLQALLYAQLAELGASQARIAEAALGERRAIERDLHDGLQHRLLRLCWLADRASDTVESGAARPLARELATEARDAYTMLRDLAQGIHPAILTEQGLTPAVEELALRSYVPMLVNLPGGRWPGPVEATAFFVIQEAATNAVKHAGANLVTVRGWQRAGRLVVEVADDGAGGADPRRGTGLRGLHDRVTALGGTFAVQSTRQQGTRVVMDLPCG